MKLLGTDKDHIMTWELKQFDIYEKYDLMGLEADLEYLEESTHLGIHEKIRAVACYLEVIQYVKKRLK